MNDFDLLDLDSFWSGSDYERKDYIVSAPTDSAIATVEEALGYKLPPFYIELMRHQNGGLLKHTAFPTTEPTSWAKDHVAIHSICGIGSSHKNSLCGEFGSQFWIDEWGYPDIGVYFGSCPSAGHDMICMDYRANGPSGEPEIVHVDQEFDYKITFLCDSFRDFVFGLKSDEEFDFD